MDNETCIKLLFSSLGTVERELRMSVELRDFRAHDALRMKAGAAQPPRQSRPKHSRTRSSKPKSGKSFDRKGCSFESIVLSQHVPFASRSEVTTVAQLAAIYRGSSPYDTYRSRCAGSIVEPPSISDPSSLRKQLTCRVLAHALRPTRPLSRWRMVARNSGSSGEAPGHARCVRSSDRAIGIWRLSARLRLVISRT